MKKLLKLVLNENLGESFNELKSETKFRDLSSPIHLVAKIHHFTLFSCTPDKDYLRF